MLDRKTTPLTGELRPYLSMDIPKYILFGGFRPWALFNRVPKVQMSLALQMQPCILKRSFQIIFAHTHTHNDTKLHTRAFRRIKMVNVENRIDVKTKNGLTIFSSSQNYSVCKFVVTHFLLDLVLFVRVRIRCTWSNEQPNNGSKEI